MLKHYPKVNTKSLSPMSKKNTINIQKHPLSPSSHYILEGYFTEHMFFFSLAAIFLQHTRDINLSSPDFIFFFFFSVEQATAILLLLLSCYLFFSLLAMLKFLFFFLRYCTLRGLGVDFYLFIFFLNLCSFINIWLDMFN